jgi:hypothetical protein
MATEIKRPRPLTDQAIEEIADALVAEAERIQAEAGATGARAAG